MYKLLIADDEPKIRNGLRKMLDYRQYGIELVGEAEDGEIAYQQVGKLSPDIIFLDICMPFLNGLELIKKIRESAQKCLIIIISGYDQYAFMQQAIKLQVFDYLLKPISKKSLEDTLQRVCSELNKINNKANYVRWMNERLAENMGAVRENFFQKLVKTNHDEKWVIGGLKYLNLDFPDKIGLAIFRVQKRTEIEPPNERLDKDLMLYGIKNMVSELAGSQRSVCFMDEYGNIVVLGNAPNITKWTQTCVSLQQHMESYTGCTIIYECNITEMLGGISGLYNRLAGQVKEQSGMKPVTISILQYIKSHYYDRNFSVEQTANKYHITPSYLSKILKMETGFSFVDLLTKIRIQKAMDMISSTPLKIYEIAELVGYSNQYYFSRSFKKVTGCSPVQFREGKIL